MEPGAYLEAGVSGACSAALALANAHRQARMASTFITHATLVRESMGRECE